MIKLTVGRCDAHTYTPINITGLLDIEGETTKIVTNVGNYLPVRTA
jgi:hypothetical protein